jgi:hypothetical protein
MVTFPETIKLECEIPEGISAGQTFELTHNDRIFQVVCPEGGKTGETIYVIAPKLKFDSLSSLIAASQKTSVDIAKAMDDKYKIVEKAIIYKDIVINKASELDEKYDMSNYTVVNYAKSLFDTAITKAKDLDNTYKIMDHIKGTYDKLLVFAVELDKKYSITATSSRLVVETVNTILPFMAPNLLMGKIEQVQAQ